MISHHTAKFGEQRHSGSGDIFLVVEDHDSTCYFKFASNIYL